MQNCIRNPGRLRSCFWWKPLSQLPKPGFNWWIPALQHHIFDSGRDMSYVLDVTEKQTVQHFKMPQKWIRIRWFSSAEVNQMFPDFHKFTFPLPLFCPSTSNNICLLKVKTIVYCSLIQVSRCSCDAVTRGCRCQHQQHGNQSLCLANMTGQKWKVRG